MTPLTRDVAIERFKKAHGDRYDYSKVEYVGHGVNVVIVCRKHGEFYQIPFNHWRGAGCPTCANRPAYNTELFIKEAREKYGDRYDYSTTTYFTMQKHCMVTCLIHGVFKTTPWRHLRLNQGCPKCGKLKASNQLRKSRDTFIAQATHLHKGFYTYELVDYVSTHTPVLITCPVHGSFTQHPSKHLSGQGCWKCTNQTSQAEQAILSYLQSILPDKTILSRDKKAIGRELDIYIPEIKFAVEYCGLFWHSTLMHTKEPAVWAAEAMRGKHMDKYLACQSAGIQLITIFEDEWVETPEKVKNALRTLVGLADKKMGARQLNVVQIPFKEAHKFYEAFHLQGAPNHGETYALVDKGGIIHSAMTFSQLSSGRDKMADGEWELTRFSSGNTRIQGGASKLYRAFLRDKNPIKVISYSDNRWFTGKMYEQLGFKLDSLVPTDYSVVLPSAKGRRHKSYAQRRNIPALLAKFECKDTFDPKTDSRTELEVTHANGFGRIYDCGKKKWLWSADYVML